MKKTLLLMLVAVMAILTGCEKPIEPVITLVKAEDANLTFPVAGAETTVSFNSSLDWNVGTNATWIEISPASGLAGDNTITIKVAANETFDNRTDKATITIEGLSLDINVTQGQTNSIAVDEEYFYINGEGGTVNIPVMTNIEYSVNVIDAPWITSTKGIQEVDAELNVAFNDEYAYREALVVIEAEGFVDTVTVAQGASTWSVDMCDFFERSADKLVSLASLGDYLILCPGNGEPVAYLNKATGEKVGTLNLGDINAGFVKNDDAGNLLICNHTYYIPESGSMNDAFRVWKMSSIDGTPEQIIEYSGYQPLGSKLGVRGDINGNAVIVTLYEGIADITLSNSMVYWTVSGGTISKENIADVTGIIGLESWGCGGYWNVAPDNAPAIVPVSANAADGFILSMYDDNNIYFVDGSTFAATIMIKPIGGGDWLNLYNALETRTASNGHTFLAVGCEPYWPHWGAPVMMVFDITDIPAIISENPNADEASCLVLCPSTYSFLDYDNEEGVAACGDLCLEEVTGGAMAYYVDHNSHTMEAFKARF